MKALGRQGCWGEQEHVGTPVATGWASNYISQTVAKQVEEWAEVGPSLAHVPRSPCPCLGLFAVEQAWGHPGQWEPE